MLVALENSFDSPVPLGAPERGIVLCRETVECSHTLRDGDPRVFASDEEVGIGDDLVTFL